MKAPSFQFYPSDWMRDLSEHPLEIEGAWIRICCALFYSETKGTADKSIEKWSRILREKEKKTVEIIAYLYNHNLADVIKQKDSIQITSRRMVKDEYIRKTRQFAGLQGGNPELKRISEKGNLIKQEVKQTIKQNTLSSSSSSSSSSKNLKTFSPDSYEYRTAGLLWDLIRERKPDHKAPNLNSWSKDVDLMIRIDKRTPDKIEAIIQWCQKDSFWQNNILSIATLRKQFDALDLKRLGKSPQNGKTDKQKFILLLQDPANYSWPSPSTPGMQKIMEQTYSAFKLKWPELHRKVRDHEIDIKEIENCLQGD